MFQKTLAKFDDGGTGGLLLNHLHCYEDTCEIVLDCTTVVSDDIDDATQDGDHKGKCVSASDIQFLKG